jgi:hypothetical protein
MTPHINCDDLNLELETKTIDTGWVNLGKCIIHLKNKNKLTGKVRMRFNYPVYGKNYSKGYFFIQSGYDKNKIALKKVKIIRLDHIKYPFKGKIMLTTFSEKEYPLKHYIVSRAPIQFIGPTKGILSLRFRVIEKIELTR